MTMPSPMQSNAFRKINDILHNAYTNVAMESTQNATEEIAVTPDQVGVKNVMASFDGTWQRRGYSSLNCVVSCIVDGKVVDYAVLSNVCPSCKY